jgi:phosphotransferase system  glucose/maltose/N-acetylglucosamine-specific IIC component
MESLIIIGLVVCVFYYFTGFRIYIKDNLELEERDYYLEWFNPFTGRLTQVIITTEI